MKTLLQGLALALLVSTPAFPETPDEAALRVLDEFMTAFNARDAKTWSETLHYPHVRIASGDVAVYQSAKERADQMDFDAFAKRFNWARSAWLEREIVQSGKDKVHIVVKFARYDADGNATKTFDSLYIVTEQEGRWGVKARSSFAP
ncbi:MAG: hypothetical protein AAGK22_11915 [Acidobacteriota bacterium]